MPTPSPVESRCGAGRCSGVSRSRSASRVALIRPRAQKLDVRFGSKADVRLAYLEEGRLAFDRANSCRVPLHALVGGRVSPRRISMPMDDQALLTRIADTLDTILAELRKGTERH